MITYEYREEDVAASCTPVESERSNQTPKELEIAEIASGRTTWHQHLSSFRVPALELSDFVSHCQDRTLAVHVLLRIHKAAFLRT